MSPKNKLPLSPSREKAIFYCLSRYCAAPANRSVRRASATIATNPAENFTNSMTNGSARFREPFRSLFFRSFIGGDGGEKALIGSEEGRVALAQARDNPFRARGIAREVGHLCEIIPRSIVGGVKPHDF